MLSSAEYRMHMATVVSSWSSCVCYLVLQLQDAVALVRRKALDLLVSQAQHLHDQLCLCVCVRPEAQHVLCGNLLVVLWRHVGSNGAVWVVGA